MIAGFTGGGVLLESVTYIASELDLVLDTISR